MNNQSYQSLNFCYNYAYSCDSLHQIFRAQPTIAKWFGLVGLASFQRGWQDKCQKQVENFRKGVY